MVRPAAYEGGEPYIFISYSHKDSDRVWPIIAELQKCGLRIWYDEGIEPDRTWDKVLAHSILNSRYVACFLSPNFVESENCLNEMEMAREEGKGPLLIFLEQMLLPPEIRLNHSRRQKLNLLDYSGIEGFAAYFAASETAKPCRGLEATLETPIEVLADLYYQGIECDERREFDKAVQMYRQAAQLGHAPAQYVMGNRYSSGAGVTMDKEEAVKWYRMAAEQGNVEAQYALASCYWGGDGVQKSNEEAFKWYRKAAEVGYALAQTQVGYFYYDGCWDIERDLQTAVLWFRRAAMSGDLAGQFMLGYCYENGEGVEQNREEAIKWYKRAARYHESASQDRLRELGISF